jgi:DnaJ-class molecular chaperone
MINLNKKPFANLTKKIELEECQDCKGTGEFLEEYDDMWGNTSKFWITCYYCEGEGKIEKGTRW